MPADPLAAAPQEHASPPTDAQTLAAATLMDRLLGFVVTQAMGAAVELGVIELVSAGAQRLSDLATRSGTDPVRLRQLLRCLTHAQILAEPAPDLFAPTELSRALEADRPVSLAPYVKFTCAYSYPVATAMTDTVRTGRSGAAFQQVHGAPFFEFLRDDPAAGRVFDEAMAASSAGMREAVAALDFPAGATVVDVGGGNGALLAAVLLRHPQVRGVLAEQPHVLAGAEELLRSEGQADRCALAACDFFDSVPAGEDVYVLSRILHDWSDEQAQVILRDVRAAIDGGGQLLIVERVLTDYQERHWDKPYDMLISLLLTGHERTRGQWDQLLVKAGFRLTDVTPAGWRSQLLHCAPLGRAGAGRATP